MQYFVILTLEIGDAKVTATSTPTFAPSATKADIYNYVRNDIVANSGDRRWLDAATLFFSAEPNSIG